MNDDLPEAFRMIAGELPPPGLGAARAARRIAEVLENRWWVR